MEASQPNMMIEINKTELLLLPQRMLYIPAYQLLCIADWHLGKAAHFRKAGIPVPQPDRQREFEVVQQKLTALGARHVFFLGDLFHSLKNNDWQLFADFVQTLPGITFTLVKGNHDIIPVKQFEALKIQVHDKCVIGNKIIFTHEPLYEHTPPTFFNIAGHVHPGYRIQLKARQSFALPCFYYSHHTLVLPAFGSFTGLHLVSKLPQNQVYGIAGDEVIAL